jgi:hypothetical protein
MVSPSGGNGSVFVIDRFSGALRWCRPYGCREVPRRFETLPDEAPSDQTASIVRGAVDDNARRVDGSTAGVSKAREQGLLASLKSDPRRPLSLNEGEQGRA